MAAADIRAAIHTVLRRGPHQALPDAEFNALALRAFTYQFERNLPYRAYCERREVSPALLSDWTAIPAVPTAAFKEVALVAGKPADAQLVFRTSGTTRGAERRGAHYLLEPALYEASLLPTFRAYVLRDEPAMRMLSLAPPHTELPDSSLSYMISTIVRELGTGDSGVFATSAGLDVNGFKAALLQAADAGQPVCLLGTSLAFVHFAEAADEFQVALPAGSRLMDTGGFKGERRTIAEPELHTIYTRLFGLAADACINEYGMTELCSQYYDAAAAGAHRIKRGPPWVRARAVDPDTLAPLARGSTGILQHFDLANLDSVCAVQTDDLAFEMNGGFVLLGRAPGAVPRGCSIAMDILMTDSHSRAR